jgi:hypothetical protein
MFKLRDGQDHITYFSFLCCLHCRRGSTGVYVSPDIRFAPTFMRHFLQSPRDITSNLHASHSLNPTDNTFKLSRTTNHQPGGDFRSAWLRTSPSTQSKGSSASQRGPSIQPGQSSASQVCRRFNSSRQFSDAIRIETSGPGVMVPRYPQLSCSYATRSTTPFSSASMTKTFLQTLSIILSSPGACQ